MDYYKPRPEQPTPIHPTQPAPSNSVPSTPVVPTATLAVTAPVPPSQPTKRPDGQRDYKYTQEISQMVRTTFPTRNAQPNLNGRLILDVRLWGNSGSESRNRQSRRGHCSQSAHRTRKKTVTVCPALLTLALRSFRPAHSLIVEEPATSRPKTSSFSSDTTEAKSIGSVHTSRGKTSASTPRTMVAKVVQASKSKPWRTVPTVHARLCFRSFLTRVSVARQTDSQSAKDHHQAPLGNLDHLL